MKIWVDGGCKDNGSSTAKMYGSYCIENLVKVRFDYPGEVETTNNVAEYKTLIEALKYLNGLGFIESVEICMDSALVVNQVNQRWKCRKAHLRPYLDESISLMKPNYSLVQVPRDEIVSKLGH